MIKIVDYLARALALIAIPPVLILVGFVFMMGAANLESGAGQFFVVAVFCLIVLGLLALILVSIFNPALPERWIPRHKRLARVIGSVPAYLFLALVLVLGAGTFILSWYQSL